VFLILRDDPEITREETFADAGGSNEAGVMN
jgi:hypothetical protein